MSRMTVNVSYNNFKNLNLNLFKIEPYVYLDETFKWFVLD